MIRRIVEIDEEKCNGCGACANACHEQAIVMVDGKAKLIKDDYCDGLGDCLPACEADAIKIIEREADAYDEKAVKERIAGTSKKEKAMTTMPAQSQLKQWPVQIKLLPLQAPYYENANLLIAADCTAYAYARFHEDFIKNHVTVVGCPKLDEGDYSEKLCEILKLNNIKSVKIVRMEVPCCGGLEYAAVEAMKQSGKMIPWQVVTITCDGQIKE
ncbi:MAG: 4Fe-4S binding protein [Anaerostipes sp.]|nr:4Fe-4S binding protein [Anaerostipes sp.]